MGRCRRSRFIAVGVALVIMLLSVECGAGETIKLGVAGAQSGDLASYGLPTVNAVRLVVEQVNAAGGINGRKIEILVNDDVCKPEIAANTAAKLVSEGVKIVLGHICSGATKAALPLYKNAGVLVMSPSATSPELTESGEYPNFFRTIAPDDAQAKLDVDFTLQVLKLKKIALIHDKGDYGKGFAEFAKKFIEASGEGQVVLFEGITPGAVDYSAIVQKIKQSGATAVMFGGYHPEASKIVGMMRKKRLTIDFISDDGVKDNTFIKVAGKDAEGVYASGPRDTSGNPVALEAVAAHKKTYQSDPGAFYENAYAAALVLMNAIKRAGNENLDDLKKVLQTEKVDTPIGKISFDAKGDAIGAGFSMYQVKNGQFVEVGSPSIKAQ
ncbi:MAG: branched-chain amino acid ABC transporter substrate-binding protein [Desulfocapsaceae bacterium]|nr:branched-chain amino acid ABC transporter substrate-binding protein [Desulfocapsaceae bacterium]